MGNYIPRSFFFVYRMSKKIKKLQINSVKKLPKASTFRYPLEKTLTGKKICNIKANDEVRHLERANSNMFLKFNTALRPPYQIILDTNFINHSLQNKIDIIQGMVECLCAKCNPCITDCVIAELEKMGRAYRAALKIARDPRFEKLPCEHKGIFADDCLVNRVKQHKCFLIATCDKDLRRRIRNIVGVPVMYIKSRRYAVEQFPEMIMIFIFSFL